jgi:UDP-N-acetylmuramyl pentapeptide phosphotransferase/UDP-N-acetylglucosamine-1-phosphate transferase
VNSIFFIIFNIFFITILNTFFLKKNILVDKKQLIHKSFTSSELVPISSGFLIIVNLFFFTSNHLVIFFSFLIFILGIFSDLFIIKNPAKKFFVQFIIVIFFLLSLKLSIISTKIFFIDYFIKNKFFALLFTAFCLLILINGSNFLDGVNTLVCGYYILVVMTILYIGHYNKINYNFSESYYLFLTLLVILIFNFFSKTYLGDSGTFLLSFVIGYHLISICNINLTSSTYISPIFILLLLWYPAFENLFSIIRKFLNKKKPSEPDNSHLHHLLFIYLEKKINNKKITNSLTGITINLYNFLIFLLGASLYNKTTFLFLLVAINIFTYVNTYWFLSKINR